MLKYLWPIRTNETLFDWWSVGHLLVWGAVGMYLKSIELSFSTSLLVSWFFAVVWELAERKAEIEHSGLWSRWESALNSWVSDVLLMVPLGMSLGRWLCSFLLTRR